MVGVGGGSLVCLLISDEEIEIEEGVTEHRGESNGFLLFAHVAALGVELHEAVVAVADALRERHVADIDFILEVAV